MTKRHAPIHRYALIHQPTGVTVAVVTKAESWWAKGWGLLGRRNLPVGTGLWLPGVAAIHTLGMRFSLDLLFLSEELVCLSLRTEFPAGRWTTHAPGAFHTLELGAGTLALTVPESRGGDRWCLEPLPDISY